MPGLHDGNVPNSLPNNPNKPNEPNKSESDVPDPVPVRYESNHLLPLPVRHDDDRHVRPVPVRRERRDLPHPLPRGHLVPDPVHAGRQRLRLPTALHRGHLCSAADVHLDVPAEHLHADGDVPADVHADQGCGLPLSLSARA
jgi:hypothetical protein